MQNFDNYAKLKKTILSFCKPQPTEFNTKIAKKNSKVYTFAY